MGHFREEKERQAQKKQEEKERREKVLKEHREKKEKQESAAHAFKKPGVIPTKKTRKVIAINTYGFQNNEVHWLFRTINIEHRAI